MKRKGIVILLVTMVVTIFSLQTDIQTVHAAETSQFTLTAVPNPENNSVNLNWTVPEADVNYSYMIYQRHNGGTETSQEYQTIPASDQVKVLQVYPCINQLVTWVNNYGQGKITCDAVPIETFNQNPSIAWNYDVLAFGFWDCNNNKDLNANSKAVVAAYIEDGRGVLFGHDTMTPWFSHPYFNQLAGYVNITLNGPNWVPSTSVRITKKGLLTNYPYQIGEVGTVLTIPSAHVYGQVPHGDIWMRLVNDNLFYLTTWNNCAMIQTGHSNGAATEDEQKLLMNTLYYLAQKTSATSWETHMGQDVTAPTKPELMNITPNYKNETVTLNLSAEDKGDTYEYYIEATHPTTGEKLTSNVATVSFKTGLKGYSVVVDQNATTVPDTVVETTADQVAATVGDDLDLSKPIYIHVRAVDYADTGSEVLHYTYNYEDPNFPDLQVTKECTRTKISLTYTNVGASSAKNIIAKLSCKEGLKLAADGQASIKIASLAAGSSITVTWYLNESALVEGELYNYEIALSYEKKGKLATYTKSLSFNSIFEIGAGTPDNPFVISSSKELKYINYALDAYFKLKGNIDFSGIIWEPIGSESDTGFTGYFDGSDGTISGLTIDGTGKDYIGLFAKATNATFKNVTLDNVNVTGGNYVGALVGYALGENQEITNCTVNEGYVTGKTYVGGLIGRMQFGNMSTCETLVNVTGYTHVGGILGYGYGLIIKDCISLATVTGAENIGGLIGSSNGNMVINCQGIATVVGNENVGGLIGYSSGLKLDEVTFTPMIDTCSSLGNVKGSQNVGGLIGYDAYDRVISCQTSDTIEGDEVVGGLIGYSQSSKQEDCSSEALVEGSSNVESLIGYIE